MQNTLQLTAQIAALRKRLRELEDRKPPSLRRVVFVMSEMRQTGPDAHPRQVLRSRLDCGVRRRRVHHHPRQRLRDSHQDKPPVFALEVASKTTGWRDVDVKRDAYAGLRIGEYWRDPSGGQWHGAALAGDRLGPDGRYVPIPIRRIGDGILRGYSEALGLFICWEHGHLRFFDPEVGYLLTYDEEHDGRLFEAARADAAETARAEAETARAEAETRARRLEARLPTPASAR